MTSREKRFEKIFLAHEKEYRFEEIRNFLEFYGYSAKQTASSHITFRRKGCEHITIVAHNSKVKRLYVKKAIQKLKKDNIL